MTESLDFPNILKLNRMNYAATILNHLRNRADISMGDLGATVLPMLQHCRSILPEHLPLYYDNFNNIMSMLSQYSDLAESCSRSGAYHARRITHLEQLKTTLHVFEQNTKVIEMLRNMHVPGTF